MATQLNQAQSQDSNKLPSQPVKVKPYKYPHSQNEEIKRLVSGMLDEASYSLVRVPFLLPLYW